MALNTFIVVPSSSRYGIIFGKNSNRPANEVQELVYEKSRDISENETKCSHVSVSAVSKIEGVILSKPAWMWGCEMGANEHGVVGGVVNLKDNSTDSGLLPQDLLRLALERSQNADTAIDVIGSIVGEFGSDECKSGFVLTDKECAWYMEAVGKAWVAKRISPGAHLFPSPSFIGTSYDKSSSDLQQLAKTAGNWDGEGDISWEDVFSPKGECEKLDSVIDSVVSTHFADLTDFGVKQMTRILRDTENRINRSSNEPMPTASSQISILPQDRSGCHWFTATPDATLSVFKPFIFTPNARISTLTQSPLDGDRQHHLYRLHAAATCSEENKVISFLQDMEANCLNEVDTFLFEGSPGQTLSEVDDLLKDCVEAEVKFYK